MPDKQIPQEQDQISELNDEREEDTGGSDPEEDPTLTEEERLARQRASNEARRKQAKAARKMGMEMIPLGGGFTWLSDNIEHDKALAREGWEICRQKMLSGNFDLVVLDELTYVLKYGWLSWEDVRDTLDQRPAGMHVVVTGRYAPPELVAYADMVSEIIEVKHPYHTGVKAQKGIEF